MEAKLGFSFDDQDFTDFLPEVPEEQFYGRWADFNHHDPGVTTVEALNFSYEDFKYRYNLPIEDMLQGKIKNALSSWSIMKLHPQYAISEDDYRSVLGIYKNIRNVVAIPLINGTTVANTQPLSCLFNINVAADSLENLGYWQHKLLKYRALGEYYNRQKEEESFIKQQVTLVNINAEVTFYTDKDTILNRQQLRHTLESYLLPNLRGIDFRYLSDHGTGLDKLQACFTSKSHFESLFILPSVLDKPCYRRYIVVAELFEQLLDLSFIASVETVEIGLVGRSYKTTVLDCGSFTFTQLNKLTVNSKKIKKGVDSPLLEAMEYEISSGETYHRYHGVYKNLGAFNSIQLSYPPNYQIGVNLANQSDEVLGKTSSFRAFLYFMDQIRANISAQMGDFPTAFAISKKIPSVGTNNIQEHPFYNDLTFHEFGTSNQSYTSRVSNEERANNYVVNELFDEKRVNYLLALNGWSLEEEIITVNTTNMDLLSIKNDFLMFVHYGIKKSVINTGLNKIFRAVSLVMLQEKIRIVLQTDVADVRILEHCFLQPVWTADGGLNFEICVFLFPKDDGVYQKKSFASLDGYAKKLVRAFTPVQLVPSIRWMQSKKSDAFTVKDMEELLIEAYPPKATFYFDEEITETQRLAMETLLNKWVCYS